MEKEIRTICYDKELRLEAYRFKGIVQPFPNHFHEYYVIGFVEEGERMLSCKSREYTIGKGDILLFQPGDNHSCVQCGGGTFDYRGFNITKETMMNLMKEVTGEQMLPGFTKSVVQDSELICYLRELHQAVMNDRMELEKEESLLFMISLLTIRYGKPFNGCIPECREELEKICSFIQERYAERIDLEQLCQYAGLSKSTLLRSFAKGKGVTPYRYLQSIRVNEAKKLLEQRKSPIEAAMQTGFADQSHFTNAFHMFLGLSPGSYREIFLEQQEENQEKKYEE